MSHLSFFRGEPLSLGTLAADLRATLADGVDPARTVSALAPLDRAETDELSAYDDGVPLDELRGTRAGACLVAPSHRLDVPRATAVILVAKPLEAFARLAGRLHPASVRPGRPRGGSESGIASIDPSASVAASARLEAGVVVDPGAFIGPMAEIGADTFIGAGSVVGPGVRIGRGCAIDAGVTLVHALVGDRVVIHAGARLGQPGSLADGSVLGTVPNPSLGRVILQNDVEVGANAIVPRGALGDTIVGEGACLAALATIPAGSTVARGARVPSFGQPG